MRTSTLLIAGTLAMTAAASPLAKLANVAKREFAYEYSYVTTTVFVYADAEPTEAPKTTSRTWQWRRPRPNRPKAPAPAATTIAPVVEQAPAEQKNDAPAAVQQAPAPAATTQAAAQTNSQSTGNSYSDAVLRHHNVHRANHSASDLSWSDSLAATANKIAQSCVYAHDTETDGGGYGQNIAAGAPASKIGSVISDLFYNNEVGLYAPFYGLATPDMSSFHDFGHFTQIVWKATTQVGCATVDCSRSGLKNTGGNVPPHFTVCNYKSAGNFMGEFGKNVSPPGNQPFADGTF